MRDPVLYDTPLHYAARCPDHDISLKMVKELLKYYSIEVNCSNRFFNVTPLDITCDIGNVEAFKAILTDSRCNSAFRKREISLNALHRSAWRGRVEIMKYLLEEQRSQCQEHINDLTAAQETALFRAVSANLKSSAEMVSLLLDAGADPNIPCGSRGETALHLAILLQGEDIIEALLIPRENNICANPKIPQAFGLNAYDYVDIFIPNAKHPEMSPRILTLLDSRKPEATAPAGDQNRAQAAEPASRRYTP